MEQSTAPLIEVAREIRRQQQEMWLYLDKLEGDHISEAEKEVSKVDGLIDELRRLLGGIIRTNAELLVSLTKVTAQFE